MGGCAGAHVAGGRLRVLCMPGVVPPAAIHPAPATAHMSRRHATAQRRPCLATTCRPPCPQRAKGKLVLEHVVVRKMKRQPRAAKEGGEAALGQSELQVPRWLGVCGGWYVCGLGPRDQLCVAGACWHWLQCSTSSAPPPIPALLSPCSCCSCSSFLLLPCVVIFPPLPLPCAAGPHKVWGCRPVCPRRRGSRQARMAPQPGRQQLAAPFLQPSVCGCQRAASAFPPAGHPNRAFDP